MPRIPAAGVDQRVPVFGALDYGSGQVITTIHDRASSAAFREFVESLIERWPTDPLVLVMDNASYHTSATLRHWLMRQAPHVTLLWLPTSSPHLNLIERVCRFVKGKVACHRYGNDLPGRIAFATRILHATRATFAAPTSPHIRLEQNLCTPA